MLDMTNFMIFRSNWGVVPMKIIQSRSLNWLEVWNEKTGDHVLIKRDDASEFLTVIGFFKLDNEEEYRYIISSTGTMDDLGHIIDDVLKSIEWAKHLTHKEETNVPCRTNRSP